MSIWSRISDAISALTAGESFAAVFERMFATTPTAPERSVAFTIAVIALGAKMAKADGEVTRNEVTAFRQVFLIPPEDEANAARVFNLARQDVAGFDAYARKIRAMFAEDSNILTDLMEGLFHISMADGDWHPQEDAFLAEVARILRIGDQAFRSMRARYVPNAVPDPHDVLGIPPNATLEEARAAWKAAVRNSHPDQMIARGVPPEAIKLAEKRLIAINDAWADIAARLDA
jgi:DnaJ like chaperone protein